MNTNKLTTSDKQSVADSSNQILQLIKRYERSAINNFELENGIVEALIQHSLKILNKS